ncbi:MAG: hypothetical protein ACREBA_06580, partial [Nitrosotalea sp.]
MSQDDEKIQIQLNVMTKILEKELFAAGLCTDYDLIQLPTLTRIEKCFPIVTLYERIIKKSLHKEIKKQPRFDKILFGLVNFHYNSKEYSKALDLIDFMLLVIPNNYRIQYSRGKLYEFVEQSEKASECYEAV